MDYLQFVVLLAVSGSFPVATLFSPRDVPVSVMTLCGNCSCATDYASRSARRRGRMKRVAVLRSNLLSANLLDVLTPSFFRKPATTIDLNNLLNPFPNEEAEGSEVPDYSFRDFRSPDSFAEAT